MHLWSEWFLNSDGYLVRIWGCFFWGERVFFGFIQFYRIFDYYENRLFFVSVWSKKKWSLFSREWIKFIIQLIIDQWESKSSCKLILYVRFRIFLRTCHSVILRDIFHIPCSNFPWIFNFEIFLDTRKSKQFDSSLKFKNFLRTPMDNQIWPVNFDLQFRKMKFCCISKNEVYN